MWPETHKLTGNNYYYSSLPARYKLWQDLGVKASVTPLSNISPAWLAAYRSAKAAKQYHRQLREMPACVAHPCTAAVSTCLQALAPLEMQRRFPACVRSCCMCCCCAGLTSSTQAGKTACPNNSRQWTSPARKVLQSAQARTANRLTPTQCGHTSSQLATDQPANSRAPDLQVPGLLTAMSITCQCCLLWQLGKALLVTVFCHHKVADGFDAPVLEFGQSVHSLILLCAVCGLYCRHGFGICDPSVGE